jgi:hypothetical protein
LCQTDPSEDPRSVEEFIGSIIVLWLLRERIESQHLAMEKLTLSFFLVPVLLSTSAAQMVAPFPHRVQLDPKIANALLIHKEEPACQKDSDGIKVTGTVVIAITIDKDGHVTHTQTLSGPMMLRPLALTTVRKYVYKPYLLNGTPVEVETTVSIRMDCIFHAGQA